MKLGFGATFSRTGKFSRRMAAVPAREDDEVALCASASSPTTTAFVTWPWANHVLTVSMIDALRPGEESSGCLTAVLLRLVNECADLTDCASEPLGSSDVKFAARGLFKGDAGGAGPSKRPESTGPWDDGINIVFLTSLRPLSVPALR